LQECNKKRHVRERSSLLAVLDMLDAEVLKDYAMLFAQIEAFAEDETSVPLFARCKFNAEELEFIRTNHPVWSAIPALQTAPFKSLVADMKLLWARREAMWGDMNAEQERCSISNVHSSVLAAKGTVAQLQDAIDKMAWDHASQMADVVRMLGDIQERCTPLVPTPTTELQVHDAAGVGDGCIFVKAFTV